MEASGYTCVFQHISEPVVVVVAISEQTVHIWWATDQDPSTDLIADPPVGNEQVERAPLAVANGIKLGIQAAFGSPDPAANLYCATMLVAARSDLRYLRRLS